MTTKDQSDAGLPHDAVCRGCKYALRDLGAALRCPECGRTFDPFVPSTYTRPFDIAAATRGAGANLINLGVRLRCRLNQFGTATVVLAALLLALTFVSWTRLNDETPASTMLPVLWAVVGVRLIDGMIRPRGRRGFVGWRTTTAAMLLATAALPAWVGRRGASCPHGTIILYGHVGYAISANGGPCRNYFPTRIAWHVREDLYFVWD